VSKVQDELFDFQVALRLPSNWGERCRVCDIKASIKCYEVGGLVPQSIQCFQAQEKSCRRCRPEGKSLENDAEDWWIVRVLATMCAILSLTYCEAGTPHGIPFQSFSSCYLQLGMTLFWPIQVVLALQPYQIATLIGVQILIIILYAQFLVHEKYPKDPDIYPYPAAGEVCTCVCNIEMSKA